MGFNAERRRTLAGLPPALERLFIGPLRWGKTHCSAPRWYRPWRRGHGSGQSATNTPPFADHHPPFPRTRRPGCSRRLDRPAEWPVALVSRQLAQDRPEDSSGTGRRHRPRPRGKSRSATLQTRRRGIRRVSLRPAWPSATGPASEDWAAVARESCYVPAASRLAIRWAIGRERAERLRDRAERPTGLRRSSFSAAVQVA